MDNVKAERELARVKSAYIGEVHEGIIGLVAHFEYESGVCQCLGGYQLEPAFVYRFLGALGIRDLRKAEGKSCWVTYRPAKILKIEPLHKKDGEPFDIEAWSKWVRARYVDPPTYNELRGHDG